MRGCGWPGGGRGPDGWVGGWVVVTGEGEEIKSKGIFVLSNYISSILIKMVI